MANNTVGFNYYNSDTDRYQDIKIKRLKKVYKCDGIAVYDYIINEIYRDKGCFIEWDDSRAFDVAEYWDLEESRVVEIVKYCCFIGLFNQELLTKNMVLSSLSIQNRFLKWSKLAKRKEAKIPEKYNLIQEESEFFPENSDNIHVVSDEEKRSKVKRSKETQREGEKKGKFSPPVFNDVFVFFKEKIEKSNWTIEKCSTEADKFINFYTSKNWFVGKNKMSVWTSAAAGWISRDSAFEKEKKTNTSAKTPVSKSEAAFRQNDDFIKKYAHD